MRGEMVKIIQIKRSFLIAFLFCLSIFWTHSCIAGETSHVTVTVCGEVELSKRNMVREYALEDAKQKAVRKVLGRIIAPSKESGSTFQSVLQQYKSYVRHIQVIKEEKTKDMLYLISKVEIDFQALQRMVKDAVKEGGKGEADNTIYFFIRVKGFSSDREANNAQVEVARIYNESFRSLGFMPGNEDEQARLLAQQGALPFDRYVQAIEAALQERVEVVVAVIGEIEIVPLLKDDVGCSVKSILRIRAIDLLEHKKIAEFNDAYELRRSTEKEAYKFILDKSAFNSSRTLAKETLTYWQLKQRK